MPGELVGTRPGPRPPQHQEDPHHGMARSPGQANALARPGWVVGAQGSRARVPAGSGANVQVGGGNEFPNGRRARP
eukprot:10204420-Heterocapsa_arctica.AAC.1